MQKGLRVKVQLNIVSSFFLGKVKKLAQIKLDIID